VLEWYNGPEYNGPIAIKVILVNVWALFWENAIFSKEQKPKMVIE